MPVSNIKKRKIAEELQNWIFLGIRTGISRGVDEYRQLMVAGKTDEAIKSIKRAIDLPHRSRARINEFIRVYSQAQLIDCLSRLNDCTIAEMNAELTILENYATNLYNRQIGGESWDSLATDIESHVDNESIEWIFPFPAGYVDLWGE